MALAVFDLDHTLLRGDSDYLWGEFLIDAGLVDAASYREQNQAFMAAYNDGTLDIHVRPRTYLQHVGNCGGGQAKGHHAVVQGVSV